MAQVPVSTPGNAIPLGLEIDVGVDYRNSADGVYAGFTWGVLWPLAGLDRPEALPAWSAAGVQHDAKAAQVLRGFLGVKF